MSYYYYKDPEYEYNSYYSNEPDHAKSIYSNPDPEPPPSEPDHYEEYNDVQHNNNVNHEDETNIGWETSAKSTKYKPEGLMCKFTQNLINNSWMGFVNCGVPSSVKGGLGFNPFVCT